MIEQGSDAWKALKCGWVGASRVADIIATTKGGGVSASRNAYMGQLIAERLTGIPMETYTNEAMQWGTNTEADARAAYQFERGILVAKASFVPHPTVHTAGASPDGMIGDEGLLEIKCPKTSTHVDTILKGKVPGHYITQMQFQMACTARKWCDFASFDPRMPESMRLYIQRVPRDDETIAKLEAAVREFIAELDAKVAALRERYEPKQEAA